MAAAHAEDLVFVQSNLWILSGRHEEYALVATKMWNIARDTWNENDIHWGSRILEIATLTLDELELEAMVIRNANCSITTSESEVQSEAIDLENDDEDFIDCLEHLSFILFLFQTCGLYSNFWTSWNGYVSNIHFIIYYCF